jgi:hypothetical protein
MTTSAAFETYLPKRPSMRDGMTTEFFEEESIRSVWMEEEPAGGWKRIELHLWHL